MVETHPMSDEGSTRKEAAKPGPESNSLHSLAEQMGATDAFEVPARKPEVLSPFSSSFPHSQADPKYAMTKEPAAKAATDGL
jgi:hypothetical protein